MLEAADRSRPLAAAELAPLHHWLFGRDETPGIVSVSADTAGRARVWRRTSDSRVEVDEHRFPNWFLTSEVDLLAHLPVEPMSVAELRAAHGAIEPIEGIRLVRLEDGEADAFRYLVLAERLDDVEPALLDTWNKRTGAQELSLADLRGVVALWPPVEQFLLLTGRTYFKGLAFDEVRRLQFDLETTGLNEHHDRIFMVSLRDSAGWEASLDTATMSEAQLLERFVQLVRERDPDVLENHNVFAFDLRFLVRRAASLGVALTLGRDGSEPHPTKDVLRVSHRSERFVRWNVAGREVVDTLHAVKRYAAGAPDLRRHGLKEAARYFGFAEPDREYVPGAEVWPTFKRDPDRVRRYAADDVHEADGLSRRLMPALFALASVVPRPYGQVATDTSPEALLDPLMVRAYLCEGQALPIPPKGLRHVRAFSRAELHVRGVVCRALGIHARPLFPFLLAELGTAPARDHLGALPALLAESLDRHTRLRARADDPLLDAAELARSAARANAFEELAEDALSYLGVGTAFFADPPLAALAVRRGRDVMDGVLAALRGLGALLIEVDGEKALLGLPEHWDDSDEQRLLDAGQALLPEGVRLCRTGRYRAVYARAERSRVLLGHDGSVALIGDGPHLSPGEAFGEQFIRGAAPFVLEDDALGLRRFFLATVARLRAHEVPIEDLCTQATLRKAPTEYRDAPYREEPYEVLLAAGLKSWRSGQRIRYFRDRGGQPRLLQEGDGTLATEVDAEHYVRRLHAAYCLYYAQAYDAEDFRTVFRLPPPSGLFDEVSAETLAAIHPIRTRLKGTD